MKLPNLPFFKKQKPREYFLALLLQDDMLRAVVFEESNAVMHSLGEGSTTLPAPLDSLTFEELLTASDKAISIAENNLPSNIQSHKTIFGVSQDWTENLQIKKEHLATLKKLCDELDLQPIGFLVFAEAIAHLLQKEEGAPVSGILVELGTLHVTATLLRAGRVISSHQAEPSDNLPKTVDALLKAFSDIEILPSRIILLDNEKREKLRQQFTNHSWSRDLPFLHVPQITPLPDGFETQAILFGTATQMGFDVLDMPEVKVQNSPKGTSFPEAAQEQEEPKENQDDEGVAEAGDPQRTASSEESSDAIPGGGDRQDPDKINSDETNTSSGDSFGFVQEKDVLEAAPKHPIIYDNFTAQDGETVEDVASEAFADIPEEVKEQEEGLGGIQITEGMKQVLGRMRKIPLSSFVAPLKSFFRKSEEEASSPKFIILAIPVILLLIIGSILWYIFGVKATATLLINPKVVNATQGITFSSTDGTDVTSDTIGAKVVPVSENGTASTPATGSQDVGDKAKGTVTIYNNDDTSHSIDAGTTITSANGLKFVTAQDVTVASASGDVFSGTTPGTQSVNVTATNIGTDYNLPSGTKFAIGGSTVIAAKNDNAFSGGTKKTVTVVSQKDVDKVVSDLTNNLSDKAKQDAQNNASGDTAVVPVFLSTDLSDKHFDKKVGDQASTINLTATIAYKVLSYSKSDLAKVASAIVQSNNQNEDTSSASISEDIQNPKVSTDGNSINATLSVKAGLLPKIDTGKVAVALVGKSFSTATSALSDVPQLDSVQAVLSPNLFFLPKTFPRMSSHITVGIKANE